MTAFTAVTEANRRIRNERSVHRIVESISSELALEPLLTSIIRHACELLEVPMGSIGLYDPEANAIRITATHGMGKKRTGTVMGPGVGLAGRVLRTCEPAIADDYTRVPGAWPELWHHAAMAVPILRKKQLIGFFGAAVPWPRRFNDRDVALLSLVARHAAIAIENAQRFERQRRRMERLALITRVSRSIAAGLDLDDLLRRTIVAIHRQLGYSSAVLSLVDPEAQDTLVVKAVGGRQAGLLPGFRLNISQGISGAAIRERTVQIVSDIRHDKRYFPCRGLPRGRMAALAVPILLGGKALGSINVERQALLGEEDAETLQLVADHLGVAIHNAAIFEREKVRARRLSLISRIGQIAAGGLDREDLLQRAADAVHELLGYANVDIPIIDADQPDILIFGARGGEHKKIGFTDRLSISQGIIGAAAREGRTQLVNDVTRDPRYVIPPLNLKNRSELAVPIIHGGRVLGVLNVEDRRPFDVDDAASLQVVADHLAVAIHNADLHAKAQRDAVHGERRRLSRDLHDSVTQLLFSLSLLAQSIGPSWRRSTEEGERKADRMVQLSSVALREMRALIGSLYPADIPEGAGGPAAQASLPERMRALAPEEADGGPRVCFKSRGWTRQSPKVEGVLYRIAQEALTNALKHARASRVDLLLASDRGQASLTITDDGTGFSASDLRKRRPRTSGGLGLSIMRARVKEQGGHFSLRSVPGKGTTIRVRFPRRKPRT
ncbi:MAG: GAF domain-containing protein [Vicinamibacteria bacterium]|nr:GAF domain-containing protein [Vicinamibacteria bacterium]